MNFFFFWSVLIQLGVTQEKNKVKIPHLKKLCFKEKITYWFYSDMDVVFFFCSKNVRKSFIRHIE